jgi:hypothetical protein
MWWDAKTYTVLKNKLALYRVYLNVVCKFKNFIYFLIYIDILTLIVIKKKKNVFTKLARCSSYHSPLLHVNALYAEIYI